MGINEPEPNIRNKLARGTLTTEFLILCLEAVGCRTAMLSED